MEFQELKEKQQNNFFEKFVTTSESKELYTSGVYFKEQSLTKISELLDYIMKLFIHPSHKLNRKDRRKLDKKQGIIKAIIQNNDLGSIQIRVRNNGKYHSMIIDGGHRVRSIIEFVNDDFCLPSNTFFTNNNGYKHNLGGMKYSEIIKQFPEFEKYFLNFTFNLVMFYNMTGIKFTEQAHTTNKTSNLNGSEMRTFYDENVCADWVRNSAYTIEDDGNICHPLFDDSNKILSIPDEQMRYFSIAERVLYFCANDNASIECQDKHLDKFFEEYGSMENRKGIYVQNSKLFAKISKRSNYILDLMYNVFSNWPRKSGGSSYLKVDMKTILSFLRFYFALEKIIKEKYNGQIDKIDFSIFSRKFHDMIYDLLNNRNDAQYLKKWVPEDKSVRTLSNAFSGYVSSVETSNKIVKATEIMINEFDNRYEEFGVKIVDYRESFSNEDQKKRYDQVGGICEITNLSVEYDEIQADHAIPRSWGIVKGGITEYSNCRILHKDINQHKKDREFEEYKSSGDWKPILEKILQTKSEKIAA
jgi:5-methylcytosine-specific restriction endonuclease McrA